MPDTYFVVPESQHNALVEAAYRHRGYLADEAAEGARFCAEASRHGIRTHNALKALHLDHLFGSGSQGCVPGRPDRGAAPRRFAAAKIWNANKKLGQSVAYRAMDAAIKLADQYGVGIGLRRQRLPLPLGRRLRDGRGQARLHRLHQLHGRAGRGRALRRQVPRPSAPTRTAGASPRRRRSASRSWSTGRPPSSPWAGSSS